MPLQVEWVSKLRNVSSRIRSLYIVHISMLIVSLGSSIIYTGVWPYSQVLDSNIEMFEYGFIVSADALGQMIFSPIFGLMADKLNSIRLVSLICCITFSLGNLFYANISVVPKTLGSIPLARMYALILARFIVGIGTAINAASRSYVSKATYESERTTHISLLSLFQTLGFVLGPAIQSALTPIGGVVYVSEDSQFVFDMYTATGWVSASTGLIAFILFMPRIFVEHSCLQEQKENIKSDPEPLKRPNPKQLLKEFSRISMVDGQLLDVHMEKIDDKNNTNNKKSKSTKQRPNMLSTLCSTYNFFAFLFNFVLLETIMTPLAIHQWGWSQEDALAYLGVIMAVGGVLSGLCFATIGPLAKIFDERVLLLFAGITPMIIGRVIMFPMGSEYPSIYEPDPDWGFLENDTTTEEPETRAGPIGIPGCPFDWCSEIPKIHVEQFMVGYVFALLGYPFCVALCGALFSKVLGPIPQGFWMGLLTTSGSLARVIGPIFVSVIYEYYGTLVLFGIVTASLGLSFIITTLAYRQLVPFDRIIKHQSAWEQIKFWKGWQGIWQTSSAQKPEADVASVPPDSMAKTWDHEARKHSMDKNDDDNEYYMTKTDDINYPE